MISPPQNPKPPNFLSDYAPATSCKQRHCFYIDYSYCIHKRLPLTARVSYEQNGKLVQLIVEVPAQLMLIYCIQHFGTSASQYHHCT